MVEMVEARRNSSEAEQRYDLFSGLLDASQNESDDGKALDDEELIGEHSNVFMPWKRLTCHCRQHVYLPSYWTRGEDQLLTQCMVANEPLYRPRRILYASHLRCWHSIRMSKSDCTNTSEG